MKMKRTLSLVLALVMVLGTFGTVFAETVVETPETNVAAGALLKELGVLVGNAEGDLMLEQGLKRQDTAVLVAKLMGEFDAAKEFPTVKGEVPTYEDIEDHFYLPFLAWAQANKTFVGHTPAKFGFDEEMTVQQFAKVLLTVLGYEVGPEADVKYEDVVQKVFDLKIIDTTDEMGFTRGVMAMMTYNALNTKMKDSDKTLAEFLDIEMPVEEAPEKLEVVEVRADNLMEIDVELSNAELAKGNLENKDNYRVIGFAIQNVELNDDIVRLTLNKNLTNNREYELLVRGLDRELNGTYKFNVRDNVAPVVEEVTVLGEYGIKVTTSEPVKDVQERSFLIDGKNVAMVVETYGRDIILTPYHRQAFALGEAVLTVGSLTDYANFRSVQEEFDIEIVKDEVAPMVVSAESRGKEITVEFDKDIYEPSVAHGTRGNAYYEIGRNKIYATGSDKVATNKVVYTFDRDFSRRTDLVLNGVQNHSKVAMKEETVNVVEMRDNLEPEVIESEVFYTGKTTATVELTFDKNLSEKDNDKGTFKLFEKEVKTANKVDEGSLKPVENKVSINLTGLEADTAYILEVENFVDTVGNEMYVYYVDFTTPEVAGELKIVNVVANMTNREVVISFNKPVDRYVAESGTNYVFTLANGRKVDLLDVNGRVIVDNNGKTVTLRVPGLNAREYEKLVISSVLKDLDGNRLEQDEVFVFGELTPSLVEAVRLAKIEANKHDINLEALVLAEASKDPVKVKEELDKVLKKIEDAEKAEADLEEIELNKEKDKLNAEIKTAEVVLEEAIKLETDLARRNNLKVAISGAKSVAAGKDIDAVKAAIIAVETAKDLVKEDVDAEILVEANTLVNKLFEGGALAEGVTQIEIDAALAKVNKLSADVTEKATLKQEVEKAQLLFNKAEEKIMLEAKLELVENPFVLAKGSDVNLNTVTEAVEKLYDLNEIKVEVTHTADNIYNVKLTSRTYSDINAQNAVKVIVAAE